MPDIHRVAWPAESPQHLLHRHSATPLRLGAQLSVEHTQRAILVASGLVCDEYPRGSYLLNSRSMPILASVVELPIGGASPIPATIWFVSRSRKRLTWTTRTPLALRDPQLGAHVAVQARGEWTARVEAPRTLLRELKVAHAPLTTALAEDVLIAEVGQAFAQSVAQVLWERRIGITDIPGHLADIATQARPVAAKRFERFGIEVTHLGVSDVTVLPDEVVPAQGSFTS